MTSVETAPAAPSGRAVPWWLYGLTAAAGLAIIVFSVGLYADPADGWLHAARYTARLSFALFLVVFLTRPLHQVARSATTAWLLRNRRYLGLNFALAHTIHLAALVSFFAVSGERPEPIVVLLGGLGYALMFAMAATSNDASVRALGRNWKRLHTAGLYYLLFIFAVTYLGGAADNAFKAAGLALAIAALGVRIVVARRTARRRHR